MNNDLVEPIKFYKENLKDQFHNECVDYFDNLVKENNIDVEANKKTISEYNKELEIIKNEENEINNLKSNRTLSIAGIVLSIICIIYSIYAFTNKIENLTAAIILIVICPIIIVLLSIAISKLNKNIDQHIFVKNEHINKAENLKKEGYDQLRLLNNSYDFGIANSLINKLETIIKMDKLLDPSKLSFLIDRYGFSENTDKDSSTLLVQSGSILGNPFIIKKDLNTYMGTETYYGSITIYWEERVRDSNGNYHTVTKSETLTASVTKPAPKYYELTSLIYGNEAAPKLKFHRDRQEASNYDDDELERYLKKFNKKLDKMVQKDIDPSDGSQFTRLHNTKFEALFNALDRNNEVEFRLLFTPLAQKNMIDLLQNRENLGYGDDFTFKKNYKVNKIISSHAQCFNYSCNPNIFVDFDLEKARSRFIKYNEEYFKGVFFDLAPLLSIPLYQQTKTREYIYNDEYPSNITSYEHEVISNSFNSNLLRPNECVTEFINKTNIYKKQKDCDEVVINSYGYKTISHVEHISKYGGDGHYHDVPVEWLEYIPVSSVNYMQAHSKPINRLNYNKLNDVNDDIICIDGIVSYLTHENFDKDKMNMINNEIEKLLKGE